MDITLKLISSLLPVIAGLVGLISVFLLLSSSRGKIKFGRLMIDFEKVTAEQLRRQIDEDIAKGASPQNALMREYHAQGLSQSRVSFWFSLTFASFGFAIIALSIGIFLQGQSTPSAGWLDTAGKPLFTLIAGTVIDAVSALFFVQSNKARQLMTEFFDKLRTDRKLDEALRLMREISDPAIESRIKGIVALTFAEVTTDTAVLSAMLSKSDATVMPPKSDATVMPQPEDTKPPSADKPRVVA